MGISTGRSKRAGPFARQSRHSRANVHRVNAGDNATEAVSAGDEKHPTIPEHTEGHVKKIRNGVITIIKKSLSFFCAPIEAVRATVDAFDIEEAEMFEEDSGAGADNERDNGETISKFKLIWNTICSIVYPEEYEILQILEASAKEFKSIKAKFIPAKNGAHGKYNSKHKPKLVPLLAPCSSNEGKLSKNIHDRDYCYVVDVMNNLRSIKWKNGVKTFENLADAFCKYVARKCANSKRIDFVFDRYRGSSPKSSRRLERSGTAEPIEFPIEDDKYLPIEQKGNFWACEMNKIRVQEYLRNYIARNCARYWENTDVVLSDTNEEQCKLCPCQASDSRSEDDHCTPLRRPDIDEADDRIILHIHHAITHGHDNICILSQDTDVFVLALHYYWKAFKPNGLKQLWMTILGGSEKYRPLHEFAERHGPDLCAVLPAFHNLTGADCTDPFGTKGQGLQADPVNYLSGFAHGTLEDEIITAVRRAEEYLIQVLRKGNDAKTFDDLPDLPQTSASTGQHIRRAFYVTYNNINILDANYNSLDPRSFGYRQEIDGSLMPI